MAQSASEVVKEREQRGENQWEEIQELGEGSKETQNGSNKFATRMMPLLSAHKGGWR